LDISLCCGFDVITFAVILVWDSLAFFMMLYFIMTIIQGTDSAINSIQ
jgi:hypothetical protein